MLASKQYGGIITESDVLKHIISIGYEFETHDLAKLSLHEDKYLINSANKTGDLVEDLKFDKNYFTYEATLDLDKDTDSSFFESSESKPSIRNTAPTVNSGEIDAEFSEYMLEPRPKDGKNTKVAITNDLANSAFIIMLNKRCRGREEQKNALYVFKSRNNGQAYKIKFDSDMRKVSCGSFSGLEIVITYYKPKIGPNIIVETFADACERIVSHLSNLKEHRGDLFMANKTKSGFTALGKIPYRKLYHKEGTNLYYLETYDSPYINTRMDMSKVIFRPQMTFCSNIEHVYDVITHLLNLPTPKSNSKYSGQIHTVFAASTIYEELMETCVIPLIEDFNEMNKKNEKTQNYIIDVQTQFGKIMRNYLFLMYIKIDAYISYFEKQSEQELAGINAEKQYFKNYLFMLVRHSNYELYTRMKYHMKKQFGTTNKQTIALVKQLMYNKEHLLNYVYHDTPEIFVTRLTKTDANYGDPKVSMESYFDFFENPKDKEQHDWLIHSDIDGESTMYPLKGDNMIIETRVFVGDAMYYFTKTLKKRTTSNGHFTLKQMADVVAEVKKKPIQNIIMGLDNKEINPNTGRMVAKCEEGKVRNENFRCVKPKTARPTKPKPTRTRRAAAK